MVMKWSNANCYGYAVNSNEWLRFVDRNWSSLFIDHLYERGYKLTKRSEMTLGKEYIAFRYGSDDFHFMKRSPSGHWSHKRGSLRPETLSEKQVFSDVWVNGGVHYNSSIYLFERI